MARKPRIRQTAYADPSAAGIGWSHLAASTQRSDWGAARRAYRDAEQSTSRANSQHAEVLNVWLEIMRLDDAHHVDEFAPAISPSLVKWAGPAGALFEFALGGWLGWGLAGGNDPLLAGIGYFGPVAAAVGLGGVFGASGLYLGHGLGRAIARFIGRADSTNLKPTLEDLAPDRVERGVVAPRRVAAHAWVIAIGVAGVAGYVYASSPREVLFETASQSVSALALAVLGGLIPLGIGLIKAYWYSREAAVRRHELLAQFRRVRSRWARQHARATRRRADIGARLTNVIASAELADANQSGATAARVTSLIDTRMALTPLLDATFPQTLTDERSEDLASATRNDVYDDATATSSTEDLADDLAGHEAADADESTLGLMGDFDDPDRLDRDLGSDPPDEEAA